MFGGLANGNPMLPAYGEENRFQYNMSALPQLQLFEQGGNVGPTNYIQNGHGTGTNQLMKTAWDPEPFPMQQNLHISLNSNFGQDDIGSHAGGILNPNPVSTGLRLSFEEDERNSSITSATENINAIHSNSYSLNSILKVEIARQNELLEQYVKLQEGNLMKGVRELNQRHTTFLLNALEKRVREKLHEKDVEIENINNKNKELGEKIKQVALEVESWQYRAKYNESVINVLKSNLQQVIAQGAAQGREGCGENEVDDATSFCQNPENPNGFATKRRLSCRVCNDKEVSVLLLPCRHLCMCNKCAGSRRTCPVCEVVSSTGVNVIM